MRIISIFLFIAVIALSSTLAQWQEVERPPGGSVQVTAALPDEIYGLIEGNIFRCSDTSSRWEYIARCPPVMPQGFHASNDSSILCYGPSKLFCLNRAEKKWENLAGIFFIRVLGDPQSAILGSTYTSLFFRPNPTTKWIQRDFPEKLRVAGITRSGRIISVSDPKNEILCSSDTGASWQRAIPPTTRYSFIEPHPMLTARNGTVLFLYEGEYLLRSTTDGRSWEKLSLPKGIFRISVCVDSQSNVYLCNSTKGEIWQSQDNGDHWIRKGDVGGWPYASIPFQATRRYLWVGLLRSDDAGLTWKEIQDGLHERHVNFVYTVPSRDSVGFRLFAVVSNDIVHSSTDGGKSWSPPTSAGSQLFGGWAGHRDIVRSPKTGNLLGVQMVHSWCGNSEFPTDVIMLKSIDIGQSWSGLPINAHFHTAGITKDGTFLAVNEHGEIQTSSDEGMSWKTLGTVPRKFADRIVDLGKGSFLVSHWKGTYISHNYGKSWDSSFTFSSVGVSNIFVTKYSALLHTGNGTQVSFDHGSTWAATNLPSFNCCVLDSSGRYLASTGEALFISTDKGRTWNQDKTYSHYSESLTVAPDGSIYVAAERQGLFRSKPMLGIRKE